MVQKVLSSQTYGRLTDSYAYNALDQLTEYVGYDGYRQAFTYDANGMRQSRSEAGDANRSTLEELLRGNVAACRRSWSLHRARPTRTCPPGWNGRRRNTCMT